MNKLLLISLAMYFLTACTQKADDASTEWTTTQPLSNATSISTQDKTPVYSNTKTDIYIDTHTYMQAQAKKLHDELLSTGVQLKQSGSQIVLVIPDHTLFGSNQNTIDEKFKPVLAAVAKIIKEYDKTRIEIVGHSDNTVSMSVGKTNSLRHANAVANFFRLNGVDIHRITVDGAGAQTPIMSNDTNDGRTRNRRVEMTLISIQ